MTIDLKNLTTEQLEQLLEQRERQQQIKYPEVDDRNRPLKTIANMRELTRFCGIDIRYNEMSKEVEITVPNFKREGALYNNAVIGQLTSLCHEHGFNISKDMMMDFVNMIAHEQEYHPARDWIDQQVWDGRSRLHDLYNSVILRKPHPMKEVILRKWALSAVAALYHPNFSCEGVLTFSGEQGIGKTTWIEQLLPRDSVNRWNKDAVVLNMGNKDTLFKALSYWITELGEIDATFKKSDIEALKGFITEKVDTLRSPYERKANNYNRQTVFYATVNEQKFLQDTENRRFWVLEVERFNVGIIDAAQLWAELKQIYLSLQAKIHTAEDRQRNQEWGWFMSPQERRQMQPLQEQNRVINPVEEMIQSKIEPQDASLDSTAPWRTVTEILQLAGVIVPNKAQANDAGKYLRKQGYQEDSRARFKVRLQDTGNYAHGVSLAVEQKLVDIRKYKA